MGLVITDLSPFPPISLSYISLQSIWSEIDRYPVLVSGPGQAGILSEYQDWSAGIWTGPSIRTRPSIMAGA